MSQMKNTLCVLDCNSHLEAALAYAALGFAVFPCWPRSKRPMTAHGFKDATTDPATIRAWWTKRPDANIGLPVPADCVVVDVDHREPVEDLPYTATARTGRGEHRWYRTTRPLRNSVNILPGVDQRGLGGYVVVPPSIHESGASYSWIVPLFEMVDAPEWLYR
jgi:putative DNA primase/helicase